MEQDRGYPASQPTPAMQNPQVVRPAYTRGPEKEGISSVGEVSQPLDTFGMIIFFVVLLHVGLMIGLNLYQKSRVNTITTDLQTKQAQLASPTYTALNTQVNDVLAGQQKLEIILNSKLSWATFYSTLDAVTPKNVRLTSMAINSDGTFKADGETATLSSLAEAIAAWRDGTSATPTPFSAINLTNNGYTSTGAARRVTFSITGQINLNKLHVQQ